MNKSKIKNGPHSKLRLIVGVRGLGVKVLMDYGREKKREIHRDYRKTELDCRL